MKREKPGKGKNSNKSRAKPGSFFSDESFKFVVGILITGFAFYLLLACIAYLFWWRTDQSLPDSQTFSGAEVVVKNWSGKSGHYLAKMLIGYGFGFGAFFIPLIFGAVGLSLLNFPKLSLWRVISKFAFAAIILSLILGFVFGEADGYLLSGPGGAQGYELTRWMNSFMGKIGTGVLLTFISISYLIVAFRFKPLSFTSKLRNAATSIISGERQYSGSSDLSGENSMDFTSRDGDNQVPEMDSVIVDKDIEFVVRRTTQDEESGNIHRGSIIHEVDKDESHEYYGKKVPINITRPGLEDILSDNEVDRIMENYDPRLDLSKYKFPPVSILTDHKTDNAFDNREVFENKEQIIKTLSDHKISISQISHGL